MSLGSQILEEALNDLTLPMLLGLLLTLPTLRVLVPPEQRRVRSLLVLAGLHLLLLPAVAVAARLGSSAARDLRLATLSFAALALVWMSGALIFSVVLPRLRLSLPKILQDVLLACASAAALFAMAARVGIDLSGLLTTSAILTAVIGLALQDTLGNVVGGLALQTDRSLRVGDWIRVGDVAGRVAEIRWRYTAIETRDWETVYLPNSALIKSHVTVVGRRGGVASPWRRRVRFSVDFRYPPSQVIQIVDEALRSSPMDRVSTEPPPSCVLLDMRESYRTYEVRYFLLDPAINEAADSTVRTRLAFALRRAEIPLAIPAQALFVTEESQERKAGKQQAEHARRLDALARVDLFRDLSPDDRLRLAEGLRHVPYTAGEAITLQGTDAHGLYLVVAGEVSVRIRAEHGGERELSRLQAGSFFGEMSLLTGARRTATVVAISDVECYRLDKESFEQVMRDRPELAESVAEILATRRSELEALRSDAGRSLEPQRLAADKSDLLEKIRSFFGLDDDERRAG